MECIKIGAFLFHKDGLYIYNGKDAPKLDLSLCDPRTHNLWTKAQPTQEETCMNGSELDE